jgi:Lambda phage tail tube protein, TTP
MKYTGKGAQFMVVGGGATPAYVEVGQVAEIGDISVTADEVEVTTLDAGDYRDYIQGFKDAGECELTVIFDPEVATQGTDVDGLIGLFNSGETRDCAIRWNSSAIGGETFGTFTAFIRDMTYNALNPDDPQQITPLFRITSPITLVDTLPTPTVADRTRLTPAELEAARAARSARPAQPPRQRAGD